MSRALDARVRRLESPHGDVEVMTARAYTFLKACYGILAALDDEKMPPDKELRAMARREAMRGWPPNITQALVDA
jgi:hypothetical protein